MVDDTDHPSLDELERVLRKIIGDDKEVRRLILESVPLRERRIFKALLAVPRGRPSGDAGRTAGKNAALLGLYRCKRAEDPKMGPWKFARWLHEELGQGTSVRANYEKLRVLLHK
jgi:hypothetical protein